MTSPEADRLLVDRALGGEAAARRTLADRLVDGIHREVSMVLARHPGGRDRDHRQEELDLVQDVIVALLERDGQELRRWDPARGRSLDSFTRLVARRRVARILGQRRGNPWTLVPREMDTTGDSDLGRSIERHAELDLVLDALYANMDARDAELFEMLFVEGQDAQEVAGRMDMTTGAVNAWRYRFRRMARSLVENPSAPSTDGSSSPMGDKGRG